MPNRRLRKTMMLADPPRSLGIAAAVDEERLWRRHMAMAEIGATGRGGVNRQALTQADGQARALLLKWSFQQGFSATVDPIGNLFIRREGTEANAAPVLIGSHLDSQPTGGNFDGVFGVLAAFEVMEALEALRWPTRRPVELVVWTNEEGARFQPTTMGSAVYAGIVPLQSALDTKDSLGISVAEALASVKECHAGATTRARGQSVAAYLEAHIEQGPILEEAGCTIGVVTGVQGLIQLEVQIVGEEAHAGTVPLRYRKDAFLAALELISSIRGTIKDGDDALRFTVGRFDVSPGAPNTVPGQVKFTIDLRHPDPEELQHRRSQIAACCTAMDGHCRVHLRELIHSSPVAFHPALIKRIRDAATRLQLPSLDLISGATHDAKSMATICPSAMIFVPCRNGISHNEAEMALPAHLVAGARVLGTVLTEIASEELLP